MLDFLRFVDTYNELAPYGEEINVPCMDAEAVNLIFSHGSLVNPPAEFASEIAELRARVIDHSCQCPDCQPDNWSDSDPYESDRDDRYRHDID
jgi:cytochrome c-type biogenesis protein CcmH/NrfF